ncbi:MAG: PIG-L deacetylase family protein [Omnitrophica WOR_2 bacterium]
MDNKRKDYRNDTLLAVLAHPDDETFGMGGTLAYYAQQGAKVYLICATRGEVGEVDPEHMQGHKTVAEVREAELRCAAGTLGLKGVYFLDYRDSGMPGSANNHHPQALAAAPLEEVAAKIVQIIRTIKPQVVITFDPIGGYHHPDHIAIHKAAVRAFEEAGDPSWQPPQGEGASLPPYRPQKLYFHTISRFFLRTAVRFMPIFGKDPQKWGKNGDIDLKQLAKEEFPAHAVIDFRPVRERKEKAAECHSSQGGSRVVSGLMGWVMRMGANRETFMRAYPPPKDGLREHDLFTGI